MGNADILLVEDVDLIARVYAASLRRAGLLVDHAPDGETALRMMGEHRYDVVLLDLTLPGISGLEVLAALQALSNVPGTPVVVLTNSVDPAEISLSLRLGAADVMTKNDCSPDQIVDRIRGLLADGTG